MAAILVLNMFRRFDVAEADTLAAIAALQANIVVGIRRLDHS